MLLFINMFNFTEAIPDYFARAQDFEGIAPCPEPSRLPGDTYRPNQKESSKAQRFNTLPKSTISGGGKGMGSGKAEASKCTSGKKISINDL